MLRVLFAKPSLAEYKHTAGCAPGKSTCAHQQRKWTTVICNDADFGVFVMKVWRGSAAFLPEEGCDDFTALFEQRETAVSALGVRETP